MATENQNIALAERFVHEVYARGKLELIEDMLADDVQEHEQFGGESTSGKEGVREAVSSFREAFPDLSVEVEDEIAEGDRVFLRTNWSGTNQGEFMGIPPTGRHVEFSSMDELLIENGRLKEHWGVTDTFGLLLQLGAVKLPGSLE